MKNTSLPPIVGQVVEELARKYSESPYTTNAGRTLRFFARFVTLDTLVKLVAHKAK